MCCRFFFDKTSDITSKIYDDLLDPPYDLTTFMCINHIPTGGVPPGSGCQSLVEFH